MNVWPWSEISDLKNEINELKQALALSNAINRTAQARLAANRSLIKRAHFRDPKTGRIGRKGQVFDV
jgi:hypothetical protein